MNTHDPGTTPGTPSADPGTEPQLRAAHQAPPGAQVMNIVRWVLLVVLLIVTAFSIGSYVLSKRSAASPRATASKVIYQCPMHPSYTSDKPGECPICGMNLEPVSLEDGHAGQDADAGDVPGLATVTITPERVQLIGVRTAPVVRSPLGGQLDLVGFVAPDEQQLKRVQIRVAGWVRHLFVNETGVQVRAGQPLLSIYSPELFQSEQEYLIERAGAGTPPAVGVPASGAGAQRLRLLGVPEEEIRRLQTEGKATTELVLHSPSSGTVLERGVLEGQYVGADTPLLTLADLNRVWVMADLYEMDISRIRVGDEATFTADALPAQPFKGSVEFIYPTVSDQTRTLKARLSLDNRRGLLRPGMYGRVRVSSRAVPSLSVPTEAVVNTGEHEYVFLARAGGRFEPRMVWTGTSDGDRIQILRGLALGDTVVSSASFLVDSESRLKAAIAGMGAQPGMAGMKHEHGGAQ